MEKFVDRVSDFANRRRLKIVSQTPNEIIADVYREEGNITEEGTPITATTLNDFKTELESWKNIVATNGTITYIGEDKVGEVSFTSEPQIQIDNLSRNIATLQSNKTNIDASNLTEEGVQSWQSKLNNLINLEELRAANEETNHMNYYASGQATVVQSYLSGDGLTWYRIWSDGWKECGLRCDGTLNGASITLPVVFESIGFHAQMSFLYAYDAYGRGSWTTEGSTSTVSKIKVWSYQNNTVEIYCCGY